MMAHDDPYKKALSDEIYALRTANAALKEVVERGMGIIKDYQRIVEELRSSLTASEAEVGRLVEEIKVLKEGRSGSDSK